MLTSPKRFRVALLVSAALALALPAAAQPKSEMGKDVNPPPITAPTKDAGRKPAEPAPTVDAAKAGQAAATVQGSTAAQGWNQPPAFGPASERSQYASVPGVDTNRLIQHEGREWRALRNGPITQIGGWLLVGVLAVIMLFYLIKGKIRLKHAPTGRLIERFNAVERASHWTVAISFVLLGLSGIIILWGKHVILPWMGYAGFSWLTVIAKNTHNFVGPLFIFALLVMFLIYAKDNLWRPYDTRWLTHLGGMLSKEEVPSGRFNAGEKVWFWLGVTFLGIVVGATGLILDFPNWDQGRQVMQGANVIHAVAATLFLCASFGHIYLGTIGMEGAYQAMRKGHVDEEWAKEHHAIWYEEVREGKRPERVVDGTVQPAPGDD